MNREDVVLEIRRLQLPRGQYVVVGGAALAARGIRETRDIDLVVTPELFEELERVGWQRKTRPNGKPALKHGNIEVHLDVNCGAFARSTQWLLQHCEYVSGVPLIDLGTLRNFKSSYGRPKDAEDLRLIEQHLATRRP